MIYNLLEERTGSSEMVELCKITKEKVVEVVSKKIGGFIFVSCVECNSGWRLKYRTIGKRWTQDVVVVFYKNKLILYPFAAVEKLDDKTVLKLFPFGFDVN